MCWIYVSRQSPYKRKLSLLTFRNWYMENRKKHITSCRKEEKAIEFGKISGIKAATCSFWGLHKEAGSEIRMCDKATLASL